MLRAQPCPEALVPGGVEMEPRAATSKEIPETE
jgi:hypothetical protein